MQSPNPWQRLLTRRGFIGLTVLAAHGVLVLLLLRVVMARPPSAMTAIVVNLLEPNERRPEMLTAFHPQLVRDVSLVIPRPEVEVPSEPVETAVSAVVAPAAKATQPPAAEAGTSPQSLPTMSNVAYLQQPAPHYPPQSRRAREEGLVILQVTIDENGRVVSVEVQRSSGHPRLDEAARSAVARALFKPYMFGGVARAASATIPIEFSLRAAAS